jgi:hypothetical protein
MVPMRPLRLILILATALLACDDDDGPGPAPDLSGSVDLAAPADLTPVIIDASGLTCGSNIQCGTRVCPRRAWCDTSGAAPVCRCGADVTNLGVDCICGSPVDPATGCGFGPAGCA